MEERRGHCWETDAALCNEQHLFISEITRKSKYFYYWINWLTLSTSDEPVPSAATHICVRFLTIGEDGYRLRVLQSVVTESIWRIPPTWRNLSMYRIPWEALWRNLYPEWTRIGEDRGNKTAHENGSCRNGVTLHWGFSRLRIKYSSRNVRVSRQSRNFLIVWPSVSLRLRLLPTATRE
jgi:hypothetical protein